MGAPGNAEAVRRYDKKRMARRHVQRDAILAVIPDRTEIPNWPRYSAGSDGSIWAHDSNWRGYGVRQLSPSLRRGYHVVRLVNADAVKRRITVHRLIALTFHGPCPDGCDQVRHLDGNPLNNAASNLAWGSAADNADDRAGHGRTAFGSREWWAENKHNAHLFAASGTLYDALARLVSVAESSAISSNIGIMDEAIAAGIAALALARGEQQ